MEHNLVSNYLLDDDVPAALARLLSQGAYVCNADNLPADRNIVRNVATTVKLCALAIAIADGKRDVVEGLSGDYQQTFALDITDVGHVLEGAAALLEHGPDLADWLRRKEAEKDEEAEKDDEDEEAAETDSAEPTQSEAPTNPPSFPLFLSGSVVLSREQFAKAMAAIGQPDQTDTPTPSMICGPSAPEASDDTRGAA